MAKTYAEIERQLDSYSTLALPPMISARKLTLKTTRKPEKIEALARAIGDEKNTRAAFEQLAPPQKMLLRLLREQGGQSTIGALKTAGNTIGITNFDRHFHELLRYALVLYSTPSRVRHELWDASVAAYNSWEADLSYGVEGVALALELADDSIELPPPKQSLQAYQEEPYAIEESNPSALLHVVWSVVRWASEREITLTKTTGMLRKADLKVLDAQLKEQINLKGFALALALEVGLLKQKREKISAAADASAFFARAPREQVERFFEAWLKLQGWSEFFRIPEIETDDQIVPPPVSRGWGTTANDTPNTQTLPAARAYLIGVLKRAGGATLGQWQSLASLRALVKSENPEFLIAKPKRAYSYGRHSTDENYQGFWPRGANRWRSGFKREEDWDLVEGRFLRQMLSEPLNWLGMVAIARDKSNEVVAFRLSPLGAHLLGLSDEMPALAESAATEKPLIIQPNFEIIAYTEAGHLPVLYQLERFATRERAERVAHYKLDRESVYRGLQDGLSAAQMREFLETHSRSGVPQNIAYSLDDWENLWNSITIRPLASIIESETAEEMDAFMASLPADGATRLAPTWALVEARYLEAARNYLSQKTGARALDYSIAIEQAFSTSDDLQISVPTANLDLWLRAKLEQFADQTSVTKSQTRFQITRDSLERATNIGLSSEDVIAFLRQTGTPPIPPNVALTLRGWSGALGPLSLGSTQVLSAPPEVIAQMAAIEELRALLWLGAEGIALVKAADVPQLKAELKKRGLAFDGSPEKHLKAPKPPAPEATPRRAKPATRGVAIASGKAARVGVVAAHPDEDEVDLLSGLDEFEIERLINLALKDSRCVVIEYQSKVRLALRKINPLELFEDGGNTYIGAWDHWRKAERIFRLDRIARIAVLDERFKPGDFGG